MSEPEPTVLSAAGNVVGKVCPGCDRALAEGEPYLACPSCLCPQHAACWQGAGCASYFCTRETQRDVASLGPAKIVISFEEASRADPNAVVAPPLRRPTPGLVATRPDPYATTSLILGVAALVPLLSCVTGPAAVLIAAISLGRIGASASLTGRGRAAGGFVLGLIGVVGTCVGFYVWSASRPGPGHYDSPFLANHEAPLPPPAEELARTPEPIQSALRSNVFIEGKYQLSAWVGSGIVVAVSPTRVRILTNRHVADGEPHREGVDLTVHTIAGHHVPAVVLWRAPGGIDVALLEAALPGADQVLRAAHVQAVDALPTFGQKVFAVGNPHGLAWTYTEGVVSNLRDHEQDGERITFIQTQTPINPGNSGGGLYDMAGNLVGMNSWKISQSVGEGLNFAIALRSIIGLKAGLVEVGAATVAPPNDGAPEPPR